MSYIKEKKIKDWAFFKPKAIFDVEIVTTLIYNSVVVKYLLGESGVTIFIICYS